jgi:single-stranded DNA-binding protein
MELSGTIKKLFETQQVSPTFRKREVVIETDENYPQVIMCEFTQDRADIPSRYNEGDKVTVSINIRGREWTNREGETRNGRSRELGTRGGIRPCKVNRGRSGSRQRL